MNEELQSTNEELQTVNEELRKRSDELNHLNAFFESVLASLQRRRRGGEQQPRRPDVEPPRRGSVGPARRRGAGQRPAQPRHRPAGGRAAHHDPALPGGRSRPPGSAARRRQPSRQENQMPRHLHPARRRQQEARRGHPDDGRRKPKSSVGTPSPVCGARLRLAAWPARTSWWSARPRAAWRRCRSWSSRLPRRPAGARCSSSGTSRRARRASCRTILSKAGPLHGGAPAGRRPDRAGAHLCGAERPPHAAREGLHPHRARAEGEPLPPGGRSAVPLGGVRLRAAHHRRGADRRARRRHRRAVDHQAARRHGDRAGARRGADPLDAAQRARQRRGGPQAAGGGDRRAARPPGARKPAPAAPRVPAIETEKTKREIQHRRRSATRSRKDC